jgi:hypothetical protein
MRKKIIQLLFAIFLLSGSSFSQDVIFKKGGEKIKTKILQVTPEEITYKLFDEPDGPTYTIDKAKLVKVVYKNGRTESYVSNASLNDPELYADQLKRAIKLNFFSPQLGYFQVSYEKNLQPGRSYELDLSLLGVGRNLAIGSVYESGTYTTAKRNAFGVAVGGGYKFNKMPNYISRGSRYTHIMQGAYVKPSFNLGLYTENYINYSLNYNIQKKRTVVYSSLSIDLGKQYIFGDKFLLDVVGGIGYMVDSKKSDGSSYLDDNVANNFTGTRIGSGAGLMFGFAIKAGILIK